MNNSERQFMTDGFAEIVKKNGSCGKPYRPSNGTEGDYFHASWCRDCAKNTDEGCLIELHAYWSDIGDKDYPAEWIYGADGHPTCTAHMPRPTPKEGVE